jgi:hypothetical protein
MQQSSGQTPTQLEELEKALRSYSTIEGAAIVIDLPSKPKDIVHAPRKQGEWAMVYLAAMFDREWRVIDDVHVFARRRREQPAITMEARLDVLKAICALSDEELKGALGEGINLGALPPSDRAKILAWSFNWPGLSQSSVYDAPQETFEAFREAASSTRLQLMGLHKYVASAVGGRKFESYSMDSVKFQMENEVPFILPRPVAITTNPVAAAPSDGALDYGSGRIVSVRELLAQASTTFQSSYRTDARLFDFRLFVCGKFTQRRFKAVAKSLLDAEPFRSVHESEELTTLMNQLADRMQRLDPNSLPMRGSRLTLQELEKRDPFAFSQLSKSGLDLSSAGVTIEPGFFLRLDPGRRQYLGSDNVEFNGVVTRVTQHRQILIGIGF